MLIQYDTVSDNKITHSVASDKPVCEGRAKNKRTIMEMVNMGVEPRTLALLAPRSKPTELIDRCVVTDRANLCTCTLR